MGPINYVAIFLYLGHNLEFFKINYLSQFHCGCEYYIVCAVVSEGCVFCWAGILKNCCDQLKAVAVPREHGLSFPTPQDTYRRLRGGKLHDVCGVSEGKQKHCLTTWWDFLIFPKVRKLCIISLSGVSLYEAVIGQTWKEHTSQCHRARLRVEVLHQMRWKTTKQKLLKHDRYKNGWVTRTVQAISDVIYKPHPSHSRAVKSLCSRLDVLSKELQVLSPLWQVTRQFASSFPSIFFC